MSLTTQTTQLAVRAQVESMDRLSELVRGLNCARKENRLLFGGWIVVILLFVIGAAAAWYNCRRAGYRRFAGSMRVQRRGGLFAIYLECY